uniref:Uncharacterized protein n=1 Tax=Anguilla anguilla TaxID=7936 RepID=A0A0E9U848_ANGAN
MESHLVIPTRADSQITI